MPTVTFLYIYYFENLEALVHNLTVMQFLPTCSQLRVGGAKRILSLTPFMCVFDDYFESFTPIPGGSLFICFYFVLLFQKEFSYWYNTDFDLFNCRFYLFFMVHLYIFVEKILTFFLMEIISTLEIKILTSN